MICVIDYKAGNLKSVETALRYLSQDFMTVQTPEEIVKADTLIFPGVGEAKSAMANLIRYGMDRAIIDFFKSGKPLLGICLGAQIILSASEENKTKCLNLIYGKSRLFPSTLGLKVPHMGWNQVSFNRSHPVINGISDKSSFYFVHSYFPDPEKEENVLGRTEYGILFTSAMANENLIATQFHPEKSGEAGLKFLKNFCAWKP